MSEGEMTRKRQIKSNTTAGVDEPTRLKRRQENIELVLAWPRAISELLLPWQPAILRVLTASTLIGTIVATIKACAG